MTQHHHVSDLDAHSIPVTRDLALRISSGATTLFEGGKRLLSIGTEPAEAFVDEPRFRSALAIGSFEREAGSTLAHAAVALYCALRGARIDERTAMISKAGILPAEIVDLIRAEPLRN